LAGGTYIFLLDSLILDGTEYATGQTFVINATSGLVVGTGLDGVTIYVQNINNWLSNIVGVPASGFVFYDDMSTIDCPTPTSTFTVKMTRTATLESVPTSLWWTQHLGLSVSNVTIQPTTGYGAYSFQTLTPQ